MEYKKAIKIAKEDKKAICDLIRWKRIYLKRGEK